MGRKKQIVSFDRWKNIFVLYYKKIKQFGWSDWQIDGRVLIWGFSDIIKKVSAFVNGIKILNCSKPKIRLLKTGLSIYF